MGVEQRMRHISFHFHFPHSSSAKTRGPIIISFFFLFYNSTPWEKFIAMLSVGRKGMISSRYREVQTLDLILFTGGKNKNASYSPCPKNRATLMGRKTFRVGPKVIGIFDFSWVFFAICRKSPEETNVR